MVWFDLMSLEVWIWVSWRSVMGLSGKVLRWSHNQIISLYRNKCSLTVYDQMVSIFLDIPKDLGQVNLLHPLSWNQLPLLRACWPIHSQWERCLFFFWDYWPSSNNLNRQMIEKTQFGTWMHTMLWVSVCSLYVQLAICTLGGKKH